MEHPHSILDEPHHRHMVNKNYIIYQNSAPINPTFSPSPHELSCACLMGTGPAANPSSGCGATHCDTWAINVNKRPLRINIKTLNDKVILKLTVMDSVLLFCPSHITSTIQEEGWEGKGESCKRVPIVNFVGYDYVLCHRCSHILLSAAWSRTRCDAGAAAQRSSVEGKIAVVASSSLLFGILQHSTASFLFSRSRLLSRRRRPLSKTIQLTVGPAIHGCSFNLSSLW